MRTIQEIEISSLVAASAKKELTYRQHDIIKDTAKCFACNKGISSIVEAEDCDRIFYSPYVPQSVTAIGGIGIDMATGQVYIRTGEDEDSIVLISTTEQR